MDNGTIMLVSKDMRMMQGRDMTSYSILHWELKQGVKNGVEMLVVFRKLLPRLRFCGVYKVYLPCPWPLLPFLGG